MPVDIKAQIKAAAFYIRVTLPTGAMFIDIFEVKQVIDSCDLFWFYFQVKAPTSPDAGCRTGFIEYAPIDNETMMFVSLPASKALPFVYDEPDHWPEFAEKLKPLGAIDKVSHLVDLECSIW